MARIRAAVWGHQEYWETRIKRYMDCELHPRQALTPRIVYVALEADAVVGFVAGHLTQRYGCDGELEWINVAAEHRKRGLASELLRCLTRWFAEQNALRVCVDVEPTNTAARSFYMRYGASELNKHWLVWEDIRTVMKEPPA